MFQFFNSGLLDKLIIFVMFWSILHFCNIWLNKLKLKKLELVLFKCYRRWEFMHQHIIMYSINMDIYFEKYYLRVIKVLVF